MTAAWPVAKNLWIGLARVHRGRQAEPGQRLALDRRASALAERRAVTASGFKPGRYAVSRSHTRGIGVAIVGPAGTRVGIDLVRVSRVAKRHGAGILTDAETEVMARHGSLGPALAWGIKEAAAKATGEPWRHFPNGLRIEQGAGEILVRVVELPESVFQARWMEFGGLVCAWVHSETAERPSMLA